MIKKTELLRRLEIAENEIKELRSRSNTNYERADYILNFLADKLGYEIKLKDVIKVINGIKSIATEVEMVEKKLTIPSSPRVSSLYDLVSSSGCCGSEEPKPKRKYNKRKTK